MAKKKAAAPKKGKPERKAATRAAVQRRSERAPRARKARKGGARSVALPGMETVRSVTLDRICEDIADDRKRQATAIADEKSDKMLALAQMHEENVMAYHHAGVELVRVPGEEKLRVRITDEDGANATMPSDAGQGVDPKDFTGALPTEVQ